MVAYPEVQARAQAEPDEVVGRARPPTFADVPSLPYIRAMVKETLRWSPIVPFGVPHASTADDWYEGVLIPKGTICLQNMRVLNSDPEVFGGNAAEYDPARYLDERGQVKMVMESREEGHVTFGYGRRVCPGRYVTEGTLAIDFTTLFWAMRFERLESARGESDLRNYNLSGVTAYVFLRTLSWAQTNWIAQSPHALRMQGGPSVHGSRSFAERSVESVWIDGSFVVL